MTPEYRKEHLAHCRAYDQAYYAINREKKLLSVASYYQQNLQKRNRQIKAWNIAHREQLKRYRSARLSADDMIAEALA